MQQIKSKSKSKSKNKNRGKNTSFRFKNKEEREKEIEAGALLYLKNEYNLKKKNMVNANNSVINTKNNRNKNNIYIKKRVFKSTDEKRVNNINKINNEQENYKISYLPKKKYINRNRNKNLNKAIKFNSSTTLNSTSIEYNSINAKENANKKNNKNKNKNMNNNKNEKFNKKNNEGIFEKEYKRIIEYNKRKKNLSQDKNNELENNYENDLRGLYAEIQNKTSRFPEYNGTSPTGIKEDFHPKTGDRKFYAIGNNYKKNNFIPTTNYTNSESPGNTRLITFQGRGPGSMPRLKKKYKE